MTTLIDSDDDVVFCVAFGSHPLTVGEDDGRSDEELVRAVEERTTTADDISFPDWAVFVAEPEAPGEERIRYVNTKTRINVLAPYKSESVFDAIAERVDVEDWDDGHMSMSCPSPTHPDDFSGEIHLDLTD